MVGGPTQTPLQRLIVETAAKHNWRITEVAEQGRLPSSTIYAILSPTRGCYVPKVRTLRGLAQGLALPYEAVRDAAEGLVPRPRSGGVEELVELWPKLRGEVRERILDLAQDAARPDPLVEGRGE